MQAFAPLVAETVSDGPYPALVERRRQLEAALGRSHSHELHSLLRQVDTALDRLQRGAYGACQICHGEVEPERLASDPLTEVCLDCLSADEQRALEHDLTLASEIQQGFLPQTDLDRSGWQIHCQYRPHGSVSGDYIDLVDNPCGDGSLYFVLGDVSGKGVSAAMLMAHLKALFHSLFAAGHDLTETMVRANSLFCHSTPANFYATIVVGLLHPGGTLEITNAGHCPPLLTVGNHVVALPATGMPLGMFAGGYFPAEAVDLAAGDQLVLYTDGLSESRDHSEREYGYTSIQRFLAAAPLESASGTARCLLQDVDSFRAGAPCGDDLTIMVIRRG